MKYPQILFIPIIMLLDYYLTILGSTLRDKKFSQFIKVEQYELNPIWQRDINRKKLFNHRHVFSVLLVSFLLFILTEFLDVNHTIFEILFGFAIGIYGMIIGRHISNILTFFHVLLKPNDVSGEITFSHQYALLTSLYQYFVALIPLAILSAFLHSPILVGCTVGAIGFLLTHVIWLWRYRRNNIV